MHRLGCAELSKGANCHEIPVHGCSAVVKASAPSGRGVSLLNCSLCEVTARVSALPVTLRSNLRVLVGPCVVLEKDKSQVWYFALSTVNRLLYLNMRGEKERMLFPGGLGFQEV